MPIPRRNPLAKPEPEPVDYIEKEVEVRCIDVMFVGAFPRSFTLDPEDEIEWSNNVLLLIIKGAEISIYLNNVLSIDEYRTTVKRRIKIDLKTAKAEGSVQ